MKTEEDEEFEHIEAESGWRKKQIALDQKAENARELGLDYAPTWVGLTNEEVETLSYQAEGNTWKAVELAEAKLKEKNTNDL